MPPSGTGEAGAQRRDTAGGTGAGGLGALPARHHRRPGQEPGYPSGVGRPSAVGWNHRRFDVRLRRGEGSVHRFGYGHKQAATAASVLAGIVEARGCGGNVDAGFVGVAGGATVRRERQPGLRMAPALPGRCGRAERATIDAGDGDAGPPGRDGIGPTG